MLPTAISRAWGRLRSRPRLLAAAGVLALAGALAVLVGLVGLLGDDPDPGPAAAPPASPSSPPPVDTTEDATYARERPGYPDRLMVPDLGVDAPVVPIRAPDRTLTPPADPQLLGWWVDGARPGAATGSALVVGHTVHTGGGALDDLDTLTEGAEVLVRSTRRLSGEDEVRTTAYVVESVEVYRKGTLARRAADLFSQEVDGRLVLLTCEDWDGVRYLSNVVVTAVPVEDDGTLGG